MDSKIPTPKVATLKAGQKHGYLTAIEFVYRNRNYKQIWKWLCDCGNIHEASASKVLSGTTVTCGCSRQNGNPTHGLRSSPEYIVWCGMIQRCTNPNYAKFQDYGGRGIKVCERWMKFAEFYADMGPRPTPKHTIERMENNGNYCKQNCKWATSYEQRRNTRRNVYVWHEGKRFVMCDLAAAYGIPHETFRRRLMSGWDVPTALSAKDLRSCRRDRR